MFAAWVGEIVHIEFALPVCYHRLMVVCGSLLGTHGLYGMYTDNRRQSTVVACRQGNILSGIVYSPGIVLYEVFHKFFRRHKYGAVLVSLGERDSPCLVLEMLEILGALCSVYKLTIPVVVDVPPAVDVGCRRTFAVHRREWF